MQHRFDEITCNSLKVVNSDDELVAGVGADIRGLQSTATEGFVSIMKLGSLDSPRR
ncbi:MAG: hypothetical protein OXN17_15460 [Candidatus Poribacteria bacterium]|nr:hypothetical protein [Candidatus Poribacteria bacterium]